MTRCKDKCIIVREDFTESKKYTNKKGEEKEMNAMFHTFGDHLHEVLPNLYYEYPDEDFENDNREKVFYGSSCALAFDLDYKGYIIKDEEFRPFFQKLVNPKSTIDVIQITS